MESDYKFGGQDNKPMFIEPGDSIGEIIAVETKISSGSKTRGAPIIQVKLKLEPSGVHVYDQLLLAKSTSWRVDTFCRCMGLVNGDGDIGKTPEGFNQGEEYKLIGLRGWVTLSIEEYQGKKRNRVAVWITNKDKLPRKPWPKPEELVGHGAAGVAAPAASDEEDVPF